MEEEIKEKSLNIMHKLSNDFKEGIIPKYTNYYAYTYNKYITNINIFQYF